MEKLLHMSGGDSTFGDVVHTSAALADADLLFVCEHASHRIPDSMDGLGLDPKLLESHIAWDPGALSVAERMASDFNAPLISGGVSRLVYDCNRPPDSESAIPARSEVHDIPGNTHLSEAERQARIDGVYVPFRDALASEIAARRASLRLLVTIHSFTPVFKSQKRGVEIGILHGRDESFANAMMCTRPAALGFDTRLNEPYGPKDGVAHTLDVHGAANDLPSVMIEVRNDLIANEPSQRGMAHVLSDWLRLTIAQIDSGDAA